MDVVYLFYGDGEIRVPFYPCDSGETPLFQRFAKSKLGYWDQAGRQFVLKDTSVAADTLKRLVSGMPWVAVNREAASPVLVSGFWERAWQAGCRSGASRSGPANRVNSAEPANTAAFPAGVLSPVSAAGASAASVCGLPPAAGHSDAACLARAKAPPEIFTGIWLEKLETERRARKYSPRTMRSYIHYNREFCRVIRKVPGTVTEDDIKKYLAYLDKELDLSTSAMNLAISALKFFYAGILKKPITGNLYRPRQDKRLPCVLSKAEINLILDTEKNPKHRLLLMLAYSSGLRVSEVVALRKENIDFSRKTILVCAGKGRKDRYTLLSDRAAQFTRDYCNLYSIESWLFPGQDHLDHLSIRSAQATFEKALRNASIDKPTSIHSLRHTFATHLLESGIDIRYIRDLLGHSTLRTTERYAHVARKSLLNIRSPLDTPPAFPDG
jgi:site-specific recombinase XerD